MKSYRYLIVGGGMTADSAVGGIREVDPSGSIGLVTSESRPPYKRPPLSKGLWKGEPENTIWLNQAIQFAEVHSSRTVVGIEIGKNTVVDDRGDAYSYEKLLLATGGQIRRLPFSDERIIYFRTFDDYARLKSLAVQGEHIAVIGGGFIGAEIATALTMHGNPVTMIFPEMGIGERIYPRRLSDFLTGYFRSKGVTVVAGEHVKAITRTDGALGITTSGGNVISAGAVVAGIGIQPNDRLAHDAGLEVRDGIVVDENLRTSRSNIYAAGDVANFFSPALGHRVRVEHEDNAISMGKSAGRNMAGAGEPYRHLPFFYSDLFDLGYEAVGECDSSSEIVEDWKEEFREGVLYYLRGGTVRGVLLWNTWGQVDNARKLIEAKSIVTADALRGRLAV